MTKPRAVLHAAWALWAWTAWICLFGIVELWTPSAETMQLVAQIQDLAGITIGSLRQAGIAIYATVALSMILLISQIGAGKRWARFMLLLSFLVALLWTIGQGKVELADVPDLGLQIAALYLLYTSPGREWFTRAPRA